MSIKAANIHTVEYDKAAQQVKVFDRRGLLLWNGHANDETAIDVMRPFVEAMTAVAKRRIKHHEDFTGK